MEEKVDKVEEAREKLESMTNVFGCRENLEQLAYKMASMHRTLIQSFASGFVVPFVYALAKMKRDGRFDDRDKAACEACDEMWSAIEKKYDIKEADDFRLPCI